MIKENIIKQFINSYKERRRIKNMKRLYKKLWKANNIIISEKFCLHKDKDKELYIELNLVSNAINSCIIKVKNICQL